MEPLEQMENVVVYNTETTGQPARTSTHSEPQATSHTDAEQTTSTVEKYMALRGCPFLWEKEGRKHIPGTFST